MPIAVRSTTTIPVNDSSSTSVSITRPTAAATAPRAGDLLILEPARSPTSSTVTGFTCTSGGTWTSRGFTAPTSAAGPVGVLTRTATASEPGTYTVSASGGTSDVDQWALHLHIVSGVDVDDPIAVAYAATTATSAASAQAAPARTVPTGLPDQAMLVCSYAATKYDDSPDTFGWSTPSSMTEVADRGGLWLIRATSTQLVDAGNTGTRTANLVVRSSGATTSPANPSRAYSLVLRPAATDETYTATEQTAAAEQVSVTDRAAVGDTVGAADRGTVTEPVPTAAEQGTVAEQVSVRDTNVAALTPAERPVEPTAVTVRRTAHLGSATAAPVPAGVAMTRVVRLPALTAAAPVPGGARVGATALRPADVTVEPTGLAVSYGGATRARTGLAAVLQPDRVRVIAQHILTGRWLHWDLPVHDLAVQWTASGPTAITGVIKPEDVDLADVGLEPWGTWLHIEEDSRIRASGILQPVQIEGEALSIAALGPSAYAAQIPYRGTYSRIGVDPAEVVRHLWAHIQSYPRGDLGVSVHGSTPIRLGTEPVERADFVTGDGEQVSFDRGGPYQLNWWENTLCGGEIDDLAGEAPFTYLEDARWNAARTAVEHRITVHHPRAGSRRSDVRWVQGENLLETAPIEEPDGVYADHVIVHGKGEGETAVTGEAIATVGGRLRMPVVVEDKTIAARSRAAARAAEQLAARMAALVEVGEIALDAGHPNAPLGSFGPGDEGLLVCHLPYVGAVRAWHEVTSLRWLPDPHHLVVGLTRRGQFDPR